MDLCTLHSVLIPMLYYPSRVIEYMPIVAVTIEYHIPKFKINAPYIDNLKTIPIF